MFKLNEKYEVDRRIMKCDCIRCSLAETSTIKISNSRMFIKIPREDFVLSLIKSCFD